MCVKYVIAAQAVSAVLPGRAAAPCHAKLAQRHRTAKFARRSFTDGDPTLVYSHTT